MCTWTEKSNEFGVLWETSCGCELDERDIELASLLEARFCPWCGGSIEERTLADVERELDSLMVQDAELRLDGMREDGVLYGSEAMDVLKEVLGR